ncbi:MAG TPA: biopolymer transporter ExbD [Polyangiaceae bacterium]|nr:biopolymer transporter ExbD [Polyangiaceae bacterium]
MNERRDRSAERRRRLRTLIDAQAHEERALPPIKSDINVTPLVDVVLVLLIIFMVVTPLIASGVAVDLPRTQHHQRKPDDGKDIIISVTNDERVYLGATRVARIEELARAVSLERQKFPHKTIFLKGDTRASYGSVRKALLVLHQADINDVLLGTEEVVQER